ncbi:MAG: hypothetical protein C0502_06365 [Opitutus sp.]|nr:hypothetical protein [Opitutus sp.]
MPSAQFQLSHAFRVRTPISAALSLGLFFGAATTQFGQTAVTWGSVSSGNWTTNSNWVGGTAPANSLTTNYAQFSNATGVTVTIDSSRSVAGLRFASGAGAYTISKTGTVRTLTLGSYGILQEDDSTQTITGAGLRLTLGAASTFNVASTGNLTVSTTGGTIATTGTNTLTLAGSSTGVGTIGSQISGTGSITKNGTGTWVLSGNNSYSGATTVNSGTLRATTNATALGSGTLTLAGGELELANDTGLSFNRNTTVSGNAAITSDRLTAGAGVTHTLGTLSIGSQTLTVDRGSNATSGTGGITFGNTTTTGAATFNVGSNALLTLGALNDGGSADTITKSGSGTLTLGAAAAAITNGTAVNVTAGTLNSNNATALGTLANITVSAGATVNLGASQTFGALNGTGGTVALGTNTLTVGSTNNLSGSYAGNITGTGSLVKAGTGTFTLTGATGYTGATTVNTGTLNIQNNTALGAGTAAVTVASGATLQVQGGITVSNRPLALNGGTLQSVSGANMWDGNLTIGTGGGTILSSTAGQLLTIGPADFSGTIGMGANTLTLGGAGNMLINSFVGNLGDSGGVIKTGTGTVTYYGDANYYTGTTDIREGTLILDTLDGPVDETIRGNLIIGDGTGAAQSAVLRYSNVIGSNNKISNTATVTINSDGLFNLNSRDDTVGAITLQGGKIITGAGVLELNGGITTLASSQTAEISGVITLANSARTFTVADGAAASDLTVDAKLNFGGIVKAGAGTMTITGDNSIGYGGVTAVNAGVLNIQHANALGQAGGGDPASGTTVATGAALQVQGGIAVGAEALSLSGVGVANDGALRSVSGANSWAGSVSLADHARINTDSGSLTLSGAITALNKNLTVGGAGTTTINGAIGTAAGALTKDGSGTLILTGNNTYSGATSVDSGVLNIRSSNALGSTLAGTTVASGAALQLQNNISVGAESLSLSGAGVSGDGALRNVSGSNSYAGAIAVASASTRINSDSDTLTLSGTVALGANTLAVGGAGDTAITGMITGAAASVLNKDGAGTLTLSNSGNTFAGDIGLTGGTLAMGANSALDSSSIDLTVGTGATLSLVQYAQTIGTLSGLGAVDFGTGGTLMLSGNSTFSGSFSGTGELVVGSGVTLTLGANFNASGLTITLAGGTLDVNGSTSTFGTLKLTGNSIIDFDAAANSTVNFTSLSLGSYSLAVAGWADTQDYFNVANSPGTQGAAPLNQVTFAPSGPWTGNDTTWQSWDTQVTPVPEPSTYGALLMAAGLVGFGYRRWRQTRVGMKN